MIKKIALEPLFHFLLLGFALYIYYDYVSIGSKLPNKQVIDISSYEVQKIKTEYKQEWHREIDAVALKAIISKIYYEKLLLNEAYSLNLEKKDKDIAKKLLKQMHFLMLNSSEMIEPSEEELKSYYLKNIDDYSAVKSISFSHVFFSNPKDKKVGTTFKLLTIAKVQAKDAISFSEEFHGSNSVENLTFDEIKAIYGNYFASKVFNLKKGLWHDNIRSRFGTHIVYVTKKEIGDRYDFDEVLDRVYLDYLREYRTDKESQAYKNISSQYLLKVQ